MRFRFCGELDAPDWILKEITLLAKISSVRVRLLCIQVLNEMIGGNIDYEKVAKLTKDTTNFDDSDVKASIAALYFILSSAAKYNVEDTILSTELQQLGLPKEHCDALCKPYTEKKQKLREVFSQQTLQLPRIEEIDWRVDYVMATHEQKETNTPTVHLQLKMKQNDFGGPETVAFEMTPEKLRLLLYELKAAREAIKSL
ncbi:COMM domain-containing protein [Planoprotostelium fungivorum]|uniref:COMM domain-containing protein n=1 Tax=Planoprotostelium fungivorum TaxID=1890364 RepID=A0A2P6MN54_9EUKA|nr:COMM domain-containing protein [Planoprotostelium fungivorum]